MMEPQGSYNDEPENAAMPHIQRSGTAESVLPSASIAEVATLLNISPDALIVVDPAGTIVLVNEHTAILFRYAQTELIGQPLEKLLPERLRTAHVAHRTHYAVNPRQRPMGADLDLVGRRKNGGEFPIDISLRPILVEQTVHIIGAVRDMTAQRLLERERTQQAERLQQQTALINLAHDAIFVRDPISRVISWNRGAEELYGWSAQEALGRMTHILLKTRFPISLSAVDAELERAGQWEGELVHTRRDGRMVIVESRQVLVRDEQGHPTAVLEINRDISERRRLEQAQNTTYAEAQAQRTFLQQVLDAVPGSIYVVHGHDARLLIANRQAASIWGAVWSPGQPMREFLEMHGIEILDAQGRALLPNVWATMRALQAETVLQHQEVISRPTSDSLPVMVNAVPLVSSHWRGPDAQEKRDDDGLEPLALVVHQDVRTLKEAEYLKDEFIGIAAHELRTPLAVLKGAASTLVVQTERGHGPQLADWQYETLQELELATDRLTDLTENLLDVTRLQAGQFFLQRSATNIVALLEHAVERLRLTTTRHTLEVYAEPTQLVVQIDARRIEQVLVNLLTNAIKYSPAGGSILATLAIDKSTQMVTISVQDFGMGIPLDQQTRIFGRFMRADNARAAGINGTGLGLYLCHSLVEQHEGRLWFESEEGEGSTFYLALPLA